MKTIKIRSYSTTSCRYTVAIGNGITRSFENKKHCLKFLANTNRFLNGKLHELNFIYSDLYTQYRHNWFYFDHHKSPGADLFQTERHVRSGLKKVEETMDLITERSHFDNGNHFVFTHFKAAFISLKTVCKRLQHIQKMKSSAVDVHLLSVLYNRIVIVESMVMTYDGSLLPEIIDHDEVFARNHMKKVL